MTKRAKSSCPHCGRLLKGSSHASGDCPHCQAAATAAQQAGSGTDIEEATLVDPQSDGSTPGEATDQFVDKRFETLVENQSQNKASNHQTSKAFGPYELRGEIARGGMGVVYKAKQKGANRLVALKMILSRRLSSNEAIQRFRAEAEAAAGLDHPGIVPVYDVGQIEGQHYFTMGFIQGESLKEHVSEGPLPPREAARIIRMLAEAIAYAHNRGIIHRDIKPSNILMRPTEEASDTASLATENTRPMITDFGLAKQIEGDSELTMSGQVVGTPQFMAPEQALGDIANIGAAADIYSLGATLYQLLTGRPPFHSASVAETLTQVVQNEPIPPCRLNAAIDRDLETICLKCLHKDQTKRYETAQDVADELKRFESGEPIIARPVSRFERVRRWCQRYPAFAALAAMVVVSLLAGTGVSSWFAIVANDRATAADHATDRANAKTLEAIARKLEVEKQQEYLRQQLYVNRIASAQRLWELGETDAAWSTLYSCPSDLRGWEHDFLATLFTQGRRSLTGSFHLVSCVQYSPDGQLIAGGDDSAMVVLWDATSGEVVDALAGHFDAVTCLAFGQSSSQLASASASGVLIIWNMETFAPKFDLVAHDDSITSVAYDSTGEFLVTASYDGTIGVWKASTGKLVNRLRLPDEQGYASSVAFLSGAKEVACAAQDDEVIIWDVETGKVVRTFSGHENELSHVAVRSDGKQIASADFNGDIKFWDSETGNCTDTVPSAHLDGVTCLAYSPDGDQLASGGGDKTVRLWNVQTGRNVHTFKGHSNTVSGVAFSPDRWQIVSCSETAKIWDVQYNAQGAFTVYTQTNNVLDIDLHPGGLSQMLVAGDVITIVDTTDSEFIRSIDPDENTVAVAYHPDGSQFASGSVTGKVHLWNANTGAKLFTCEDTQSDIYNVVFGSDGKYVFSGANDGTIKKWDASTGKLQLTIPREDDVDCKSFDISPDGSQIVSGDANGAVTLWDAHTGKRLQRFEGLGELPKSVAFSPDGKQIVGGGESGTLKLWDMKTGDVIHTLRRRTHGFHTVGFTNDGKRIVSSGHENVVLWDVKSGQQTLVLLAEVGGFYSLAMGAAGRGIYASSYGGWVTNWSTEKFGQDQVVVNAIASRCQQNVIGKASNKLEESILAGGKGGDLAFEAIGDDGAFLIGVRRHYVNFEHAQAISGLDLIFKNADGSVSSKFIGVPGATIHSNVAPAGYFVSGALVGHTRWLHNLELHFRPILSSQPQNAFTRGWLPVVYEMEQIDFDFDRRSVIGVRGRHGYVIDSIQFITAGER